MDSGFDEGDFKKARGMLLSFSSILIGLWFFGADLRSVSVFGTTVAFTQNTQHVWLIAMALNGYFLLRFYQQSEAVPYATNSEYRVSFPRFLVSSTRIIHRKALKQMFQEQMSHMSLPTTPFRWEVVNARHDTLNNPGMDRALAKGISHVITYHIRLSFQHPQTPNFKTPAREYQLSCPYWLVTLSHYRAKFRANLMTSHGTEYTLPYLWGLFAIGIAFYQWGERYGVL